MSFNSQVNAFLFNSNWCSTDDSVLRCFHWNGFKIRSVFFFLLSLRIDCGCCRWVKISRGKSNVIQIIYQMHSNPNLQQHINKLVVFPFYYAVQPLNWMHWRLLHVHVQSWWSAPEIHVNYVVTTVCALLPRRCYCKTLTRHKSIWTCHLGAYCSVMVREIRLIVPFAVAAAVLFQRLVQLNYKPTTERQSNPQININWIIEFVYGHQLRHLSLELFA